MIILAGGQLINSHVFSHGNDAFPGATVYHLVNHVHMDFKLSIEDLIQQSYVFFLSVNVHFFLFLQRKVLIYTLFYPF